MCSLLEYYGFVANYATKSNAPSTKNVLNKKDDYYQELEKTLNDIENESLCLMRVYKQKVRK